MLSPCLKSGRTVPPPSPTSLESLTSGMRGSRIKFHGLCFSPRILYSEAAERGSR